MCVCDCDIGLSAIGLFVLELIEHLCLLPITQFVKLWLVAENVAQTSVAQIVCRPNDCTSVSPSGRLPSDLNKPRGKFACQTVKSTRRPIHLGTTTAYVWNAQITAQTQANSNANGLIIQPETICRNWKSMEPITTVGRNLACSSLLPKPVSTIASSCKGCNTWFIPERLFGWKWIS